MHWETIKTNGAISIDGEDRDLSHLSDIVYNFTIPAKDKLPEINLELLVQYGSHCVSWGPSFGQLIDFNNHGQDRRIIDEYNIHRCFCDERYSLSLNLPGVFGSFINRKCYFTGRENWMTIEVLTQDGDYQDYEIFFTITKQSKRYLRLYVESAYVRTVDGEVNKPSKFRKEQKIYSKTLLGKIIRGEKFKR